MTAGTLSGMGIDTAGQSRDIWIAESVLAELRASAAANLDRERAQFLVGRLVAGNGQATVVISGMFPAHTETGSSATHFGFSPNTFEAARREVNRRNDGMAILGWAHNHPPPCKRACLGVVPACPSDNLFFSPQDRTVHRAGFSAPYTVALVAGKAAEGGRTPPGSARFGWRDGVIVEKSFGAFGG